MRAWKERAALFLREAAVGRRFRNYSITLSAGQEFARQPVIPSQIKNISVR
jgi:hypothetical protein